MSFIIQKANKRHLADINRLITETRIGDAMKKLQGSFWFVRIDGRIVGCVGAELIPGNMAILAHLAVEQSYRKRGIGMALFDYAVRFAHERGSSTVALITMYYHFRRFKKRGFATRPRKLLPESLRNHWMFSAKRYMKCAAMIREFPP